MHVAVMDLHDRLRFARLKAGYQSAAEAARRLAVPYGTYSGHENGSRGIKGSDILKYAKAFGVPAAWLTLGDSTTGRGHVFECIGTVGELSNGQVNIFASEGSALDTLILSIGDGSLGYLKVVGGGLRGIADEGYIIICSNIFEVPIDKHLGNMCVCKLADGKFYIRDIFKSAVSGRFDLDASLFSSMRAQKVDSVSLIYMIATKYMAGIFSDSNKKLDGYLKDSGDLPEPKFADDEEFQPRQASTK